MHLEQHIAAYEGANSVDQLVESMQETAKCFGFQSFNFVDASPTHEPESFWAGTAGQEWEAEDLSKVSVAVDPTLSQARRTNVPFSWGADRPDTTVRRGVRPDVRTGPKPGAVLTFEAAEEFGFRDGIVIPLHHVDRVGRPRSCCMGFFWTEYTDMSADRRTESTVQLHALSLYWMQRMTDVVAIHVRSAHAVITGETAPAAITDREREVLRWSSRGKTTAELAEIMEISEHTAKWHLRNAMRKLDAHTRTQATTKALYLRLIDF